MKSRRQNVRKRGNIVLRPHFLPTGLFLMLQRLGIVIAIPGLIPALLAKGDRRTAHKHLGAVLNNALTFVQQFGVTLACTFPAAPMQGLKLVAAV